MRRTRLLDLTPWSIYLAPNATTPPQALPVVAMTDGRLIAVIPGRALWSPEEVEAFIALCETLSNTPAK